LRVYSRSCQHPEIALHEFSGSDFGEGKYQAASLQKSSIESEKEPPGNLAERFVGALEQVVLL
jgi:hypothetical protein